MSKPTRRAKAAFVAAKLSTVAVMTLGGAGHVQAAEQNIERDWQHFLECAEWLFTDPVKHADNCSPSRVAPLFGSLSTPVAGSPPPPPVEEEDPYDYDYDYD